MELVLKDAQSALIRHFMKRVQALEGTDAA